MRSRTTCGGASACAVGWRWLAEPGEGDERAGACSEEDRKARAAVAAGAEATAACRPFPPRHIGDPSGLNPALAVQMSKDSQPLSSPRASSSLSRFQTGYCFSLYWLGWRN